MSDMNPTHLTDLTTIVRTSTQSVYHKEVDAIHLTLVSPVGTAEIHVVVTPKEADITYAYTLNGATWLPPFTGEMNALALAFLTRLIMQLPSQQEKNTLDFLALTDGRLLKDV